MKKRKIEKLECRYPTLFKIMWLSTIIWFVIGIANYFDIDPVIVRLAWVIFIFCGGGGLIAYLIAALILPERPSETIVK